MPQMFSANTLTPEPATEADTRLAESNSQEGVRKWLNLDYCPALRSIGAPVPVSHSSNQLHWLMYSSTSWSTSSPTRAKGVFPDVRIAPGSNRSKSCCLYPSIRPTCLKHPNRLLRDLGRRGGARRGCHSSWAASAHPSPLRG